MVATETVIAERIARAAHAEQKDTVTGAPYIEHVERVVALVDGDEAKAVAWLHDVLEDNPRWSRGRLRLEGVSVSVVEAVDLLTRQPPFDYAGYIAHLQQSGNQLALAVKLADLRDHLQPNCPERLRAALRKGTRIIAAGLLRP